MIKKIIIYQNDNILSLISRNENEFMDICSILIKEKLETNFINKIVINKINRIFYILCENNIKILIETTVIYPPLVIKLILHDLNTKLKTYYHDNIITDTIITFQWITDIYDHAQCPIKYKNIYNVKREFVKEIREFPFDENRLNLSHKGPCTIS